VTTQLQLVVVIVVVVIIIIIIIIIIEETIKLANFILICSIFCA